MSIAEIPDLELAYEGTITEAGRARAQYLLDTHSARLRVLLPTLADRMVDDENLTLLAKDVVVQSVIAKLEPDSGPQVRSESQGVGPWNTTVTYHQDRSGTFSDEDLALLGGGHRRQRVGTINVGRPNWHNQ